MLSSLHGVLPTPPPHQPQATASASSDSITRQIQVAELLGQDREIILVHAGQEYRLQVTKNGKLILTK